jgi:hypothetical protein
MAAVVVVAEAACRRGFPASKSPASGEYLKRIIDSFIVFKFSWRLDKKVKLPLIRQPNIQPSI